MNCLIRTTDAQGNRKTLPIRLPEMPLDEKAAFVEHVCGLLVQSRFGHASSPDPFVYFGQVIGEAEELTDAMFDLFPRLAVPEQSIEEHERELYRTSGETNGASDLPESSSFVDIEILVFESPTTLGRGSP